MQLDNYINIAYIFYDTLNLDGFNPPLHGVNISKAYWVQALKTDSSSSKSSKETLGCLGTIHVIDGWMERATTKQRGLSLASTYQPSSFIQDDTSITPLPTPPPPLNTVFSQTAHVGLHGREPTWCTALTAVESRQYSDSNQGVRLNTDAGQIN